MSKRYLAVLLAVSLVGGLFAASPAMAQEPPAQPTEVPPVVNIEDPYGDAEANGTQTDIGKVWFTHDASTVSVHFLTNGAPNANSLGFQFVVQAGAEGCLFFEGYYDGSTYTSESVSRVRDTCNEIDAVYGTFVFAAGPGDEGGLASITVPREGVPSLADDAVIAQPFAQTWIFAGGEQITPTGYRGVREMVDDTDTGTDYSIVTEAPKEKAKKSPPGKNDPPGKGKKKGCKKGKGKKKGACPGKKSKKPKPPKAPAADQCEPYVPGELGKDAALTVVTSEATEEKPIEVELDFGLGIPENPNQEHVYHNVQVAPEAAESGLYVRFEFATYEDMDLYLYNSAGEESAHAAGYNPAPVPVALGCCDGTGSGGHSEQGAEVLDGIRTPRCGGYTVDMRTFQNNSGSKTLKLWLGEPQNDPAAPPGAFGLFYDLMGL